MRSLAMAATGRQSPQKHSGEWQSPCLTVSQEIPGAGYMTAKVLHSGMFTVQQMSQRRVTYVPVIADGSCSVGARQLQQEPALPHFQASPFLCIELLSVDACQQNRAPLQTAPFFVHPLTVHPSIKLSSLQLRDQAASHLFTLRLRGQPCYCLRSRLLCRMQL